MYEKEVLQVVPLVSSRRSEVYMFVEAAVLVLNTDFVAASDEFCLVNSRLHVA